MTPTRRSCARAVALVAALGPAALSGAAFAAPLPERSDAWEAADCEEFDLVDVPAGVDCGYVTVPLRHAEPDGPAIELATVVLRAPKEGRAPDPVFIAQGGPGGSSIASFAQALIDDPELWLSPNRDHVVWDQRGTYYSWPALLCPEALDAALDAAGAPETADPEHDPEMLAMKACGQRLAEEVDDLSAFNTVENADDVESLRAALGYGPIDYYGVSYGTQLGQYLMRQHPSSLRAVILDAVVPTDFSLVTDTPFVIDRIGGKYFDGCAADPACAAAYPSLEGRLVALLERLDREPVTLSVVDPEGESGSPTPVRLTGELLGDLLYGALYSPEAYPVVPLVVDRATRGDYSLIENLLLADAFLDDGSAEGMYLAVVCAERGDDDPESVDYTGLAPRIAERGRQEARETLALCRDWGIELLPREVLERVASETPTLLLSGEFDPITPPGLAERVAASLGRAQQVVFPTGAHGQAFGEACATDIIRRFLDRPGEPAAAACAAEPAARFLLPTDVIVLPAVRGAISDEDEIRGRPLVVLLAGALLVLATSLVVYPLGWLATRGRDAAEAPRGAAAAVSRSAPWLAAGTLVLLFAFARSLVGAIFRAADEMPALFYIGAICSDEGWIFGLARSGAAFAGLMALAAIVLWAGRQRSLAGRIYYTILTVAALAAALDLHWLGLLWP